jgi:transcriptional regulator with XRE-family HTH domain
VTTVHRMGELVGRALADSGVTQKVFAAQMGVTPKHVSQVTTGKVACSPTKLDEWAAALSRRWSVALLPVKPYVGYWARQPPDRLYEVLMGCLSELHFIEETLADALGYHRSHGGPDDPNGGGYVIGDHTAPSLAREAVARMRRLNVSAPENIEKEVVTWTVEDLDRCEHGRHSIDSCVACPHGHSEGNAFLLAPQNYPTDRRIRVRDGAKQVRIGTTVHGYPIWVTAIGPQRGKHLVDGGAADHASAHPGP